MHPVRKLALCARRRQPKVELIEHVYAVPGTGQTSRHSYLHDDDDGQQPPEPAPRPRFLHAYSDVADARPPDQPPQPTPASPAYADVEEVSDADADGEKGRKRFQFRFRKRPSVSSSGTSSSLYEDVNPLPAAASKGNAGTAKSSSLPKLGAAAKAKGVSQGSLAGGSSPGGKKGGKGGGDPLKNKTSKASAREAPVYVHVVEGSDGQSDDGSSAQTCKGKPGQPGGDKNAVAPLAAKFIENVDKSTQAKLGARGKTDPYSSRLYPLQEGRVATLVSTLNRNKDPKNGVAAKEQNKVT